MANDITLGRYNVHVAQAGGNHVLVLRGTNLHGNLPNGLDNFMTPLKAGKQLAWKRVDLTQVDLLNDMPAANVFASGQPADFKAAFNKVVPSLNELSDALQAAQNALQQMYGPHYADSAINIENDTLVVSNASSFASSGGLAPAKARAPRRANTDRLAVWF